MKYGNRAHNILYTDALSGRCYITSHDHGFQVEAKTLPPGWREFFQNANDGSNEGMYCVDKSFFLCSFTRSPRDTEFLFVLSKTFSRVLRQVVWSQ